MTQLSPLIPLETPKGKATAHFLIDYGQEHSLIWVCFMDDTGECWSWKNEQVRLRTNLTMGRTVVSPVAIT